MATLTDAECAILLVIAGITLVGLIAALIHDDWENIKQLFHRSHKSKAEDDLPTIQDCVKMCEENPEVCEMLAYLQKEKEKEKMNTEMPRLLFGDVVKWDDDHYGLVANTRVYYLININGLMGPSGVSKDNIANIQNDNHVVRVYRKNLANGFDQTDLYSIQQGCAKRYVIWEKQQVREMTVDEISKALGYTVKVIGKK